MTNDAKQNDSAAKMTTTKKATINCGFFGSNTMEAAVLVAAVVVAVNEYVYHGDDGGSDDNGDDEVALAALANADVAAVVATVSLHLPGQTANLQLILIQ
jgi:hypothetical protein